MMLRTLEARLREEEANNTRVAPGKIERLKGELRAIAVLLETKETRRPGRRRKRRVIYRP